MTTVYLHIGAPKTATSTLQSVLAKNARKLLKQGVLYPESLQTSGAHHVLACDLIEKFQGGQMPDAWYGSQPRGQGWQTLQREIAAHEGNADKVIVSSELFFGQSHGLPAMLTEMAGYLEGYDVRVVVYLRRQDQLYSSFYNQDVKGMRQWPENAYAFYETHQIFKHDYLKLLGMWSEVFGKENIILRPFESDQWPEGDVLQDFCAATGIEGLSSSYKDQNESLGGTQLYLKRCLNRVGFDKSLNDEVVNVLARVCPEEPASPCIYVHRGLYRKYRRRWMVINRSLAQEYLQGEPLFHQPIPDSDEVEPYKVNPINLGGSIQLMVKQFGAGKHASHRALFSRAALLALAEQNLWHVLDPEERGKLLQWV